MAGPAYLASGAISQSSGATTLTPAKPTVSSLRGVLIALLVTKNNATHSTATSGWTKISQTNSGANLTASLWIAAEGASAPAFTWTGSVACAAIVHYYADDLTSPRPLANSVSVSGTTGSGTGTTHTSTGFSSDANNTLALYFDICDVNTAVGTPSGWTEDGDSAASTAVMRFAWGSKAIATSGSSSGNISVTGGNGNWVQFQIEIKQDLTGAGLEITKAGLQAWIDPPAGADFSKVQVLAWLDTNDVRFSKVELLAWLDEDGSTAPDAGRRRMSFM